MRQIYNIHSMYHYKEAIMLRGTTLFFVEMVRDSFTQVDTSCDLGFVKTYSQMATSNLWHRCQDYHNDELGAA